jgi:hypothetical protein
MPDFGIFRGFNEKLFGDKLYAGQLPINLGLIGSEEVFDFTGLLDDYPNAAAAFSLRKLRRGYTGSCIRVRRASDNSEQNIGFTLFGGLDISALTTFCSGTDGFVKTLYDQSGSANNITQVTSADQPKIVSSGSYLGFIDFSGNNALISLSNVFGSGLFSSFMVVQNEGNAVFGMGNLSIFYAVAQNGSSIGAQSGFSSMSYFRNSVSIGDTRQDIYSATTSFSLLTSLGIQNNSLPIRLGYQSFNAINFKEMILYPNQTISRTGVESNIIDFYNL